MSRPDAQDIYRGLGDVAADFGSISGVKKLLFSVRDRVWPSREMMMQITGAVQSETGESPKQIGFQL